MQTWAKRGLQTALVTGGLLMLGTGIASADENVNPDAPASPLDLNVTAPIQEANNAVGTPLGQLDLPAGQPEQAVYAHLRELASRNVSTEDEVSFLGGGMYDHYVPALIDMLMSRSEFLTPYTPYQPEVSQGGLQVMFEYQTAISELTGLPVSNATLYEGPSALGAAGFLARQHHKRTRFLISRGVSEP
jgi:glycine cleavage system pyridoxal-binding protein P